MPKTTRRWQLDPTFGRLVDDALGRAEGAPPSADLESRRVLRLFNLTSLIGFTRDVTGVVAEVGVFRGGSALLMCKALQLDDDGFTGTNVHLFDSFEGLSELGPEDRVDARIDGGRPRRSGMFAATLASAREALTEFPEVTFHPGWIPDCFADADALRYRLVHIDVDLYEPTLDALRHFAPRMSPGGVIVLDDYGAVRWPGVAKATTDYTAAKGGRVLELSTGQALFFAPDPGG